MEESKNNDNKVGFLFDLDGVLIDSETEYTRIWSEIDRRFHTGTENLALRIKGMTLGEILNTYFPAEQHAAVIDMLNEQEQQMRYNWLPGAREFLDQLRERGIRCVLVTSSNDMKMRHLREERPDLPGYFANIVTADKISRSKPDPEGYLLGAKMLGLHPRQCVVVEDSMQGVKAGRAAGATVLGLSTTLPADQIRPWCDMVAADLSEVNVDMFTGFQRL